MPGLRLSAAEVTAIQARFAAGESVAVVAASLGRSRQSLARIKGAMDRHQARRLDVKLNIRVTQGERVAFQAVADASGLTVSEAVRHLVKQASGLLVLQAEELAAISAARRELAAVGNNLNQLARLGASGKLKWNPGDTALVRRVADRVDEVSEGIVLLVSALGSHQGLPIGAAVALPFRTHGTGGGIAMTGQSVEDLVLGHVLDGKRRGGGGGADRLGTSGQRRTRGLLRNASAPRSWQSVVKRIAGGSARTPQELKRLLDYVAREEGVQSTWCNLAGYERDFDPAKTKSVAEGWSSSWRGAPKRGHTDHIVLSFPRGTDVEQAQAIAREWGQEVFGSGDYGDVWRYVAALHKDTDHVHAHFVVEKHGIEHGRFLSICRYSELNFDIMRELHAEISQEHGLNIVATSRLSRGLIENPSHDAEMRAAHASGASTPPAPPPLSDAERARRLEALQDFARDYDALGQIAAIAAGPGGEPGTAKSFLTRLSEALGASADALRQGLPQMPDLSLHDEGDAAAKIEAARAEMIAAAAEAWNSIRSMEPSAERVELERSFAEQARTSLPLVPENILLAEHARTASHDDDPYFHPTLATLARLEHGSADGLSLDAGLRATLAHVREEIGERLGAIFALREDDLTSAGTSVAEMVARFSGAERSEGQLASWASQEDPSAKVLWLEAERDLARAVSTALETVELPPDLSEAMARDQLLSADRHLKLSEVPALEAIVDRVHDVLNREDLDRVLHGDLAPLAEQVRDPALRAAVAHELKNEADLGLDDSVGPWADLARSHQRASDLGQRERDSERDHGHEL